MFTSLLLLSSACAAPSLDACLLARVDAPTLTESSGLAESRARPGTWYTINDSGNKPEIFSFNLEGRFLGTHAVEGASLTDWEDLGVGPCPTSGGSCLFIADIGDNSRSRPSVTLWIAPEPLEGAPTRVEAAITATYPDGAHNAESILVHPTTGQVWLVTKDKKGASQVYRFPSSSGALVPVARISFTGDTEHHRKATGGAWSPDGSRVAVRTYAEVWEWTVHPDDPEAHWKDPPRTSPLPKEEQGETLAWARDGRLITTSEGRPMPVSAVPCKPR